MALMLARSNLVAARPTTRPSVLRAPVPVRPVLRPAAAYKGVDADDVNQKLQVVAEDLQKAWERTEDKPAAVAVTAAGLLLLITASSVVDTIDRIPILSSLIELVGVGVTGWFTWRFLVFGPDREELVSNIKAFIKKVYGTN